MKYTHLFYFKETWTIPPWIIFSENIYTSQCTTDLSKVVFVRTPQEQKKIVAISQENTENTHEVSLLQQHFFSINKFIMVISGLLGNEPLMWSCIILAPSIYCGIETFSKNLQEEQLHINNTIFQRAVFPLSATSG